MQKKMWVYKEYNEEEVDRLAAGAGISRLLAKVFVSRGVSGPEGIKYVEDFLDIDAERMHDPFLMDGMDVAVERVLRAVAGGEKILIHGDYDVDGVTGVSILYDFLRLLGADVVYLIPDRMEDGYGLTMSSAGKVRELEPSLVITVDCGITSVDEVRYLTESGIDVIVTDHHECKQELPQALAVLNPHKPG
ncbi:MAG TPA: DHH family phosphoesterase, partial [Clostridiales bacterium]|nr:DHH family phosphoesterase [Clostridiales bacterium]